MNSFDKEFENFDKDFDKEFKRARIIKIIVVLAVAIGSSLFFYSIIQDQNNRKEVMQSKLGTKIWFDKDSVIITDYDLEDNTYSLSSGQKIHYSLVK